MRSNVSRTRFLAAAAAAPAAFNIVAAPARAAEFTYKLAHPDPRDLATAVMMTEMASAIKRETNGRLDIQVFGDSQLGGQPAMLSQTRLGSTQFVWMNMGAYASVIPVVQIISLGFVFNSAAQLMHTLDVGLGEYIRKEVDAKGLFCLPKAGVTGFRQFTSSVKPIKSVDDMPGYRVRTLPSPIFVDLFKTLGASPVALNSDEMYTACQTHLVDGTELPLSAIQGYRIWEVQKYISISNHICTAYLLLANKAAWNALPPDIQSVVLRNQAKYAFEERKIATARENSVGDLIRREGLQFNNTDVSGMRAKLGPFYAKWKGEFGNTAWALLEEGIGRTV